MILVVTRSLIGACKLSVLLTGIWVLTPQHFWEFVPMVWLYPALWVVGYVLSTVDDDKLEDKAYRIFVRLLILWVTLIAVWAFLRVCEMFAWDVTNQWQHMLLMVGLFFGITPTTVKPGVTNATGELLRATQRRKVRCAKQKLKNSRTP